MAARTKAALRKAAGRPPESEPVPQEHVGSHRRAELLARLESGHGQRTGAQMHFAVDLSRILVFGQDGRRVDPVLR